LTLAAIVCILNSLMVGSGSRSQVQVTHRPHPICALAAISVFVASLVFASRPVSLIILLIMFLSFSVLSGANLLAITRKLGRLWPAWLLVFAVHALVSYRYAGYWGVPHEFHVQVDVIRRAVFFVVRLVLILAAGAVLDSIHPVQRYGEEVGRVLSRLPFGRGAVGQIELILNMALRFVPTLEREHGRIRMALAARGEAVGGRVVSRVRAAYRVLYPLLVNALRRADHVSLALLARGYDRSVPRSRLQARRVGHGELAATVVFCGLCAAVPWL
jgi:energy-coupling factor transporter transmembrane protein EcfT